MLFLLYIFGKGGVRGNLPSKNPTSGVDSFDAKPTCELLYVTRVIVVYSKYRIVQRFDDGKLYNIVIP